MRAWLRRKLARRANRQEEHTPSPSGASASQNVDGHLQSGDPQQIVVDIDTTTVSAEEIASLQHFWSCTAGPDRWRFGKPGQKGAWATANDPTIISGNVNDFYGVKVRSGHVTSLEIYDNRLSGLLSEESLSGLKHVVSLDLCNNEFGDGGLPSTISCMVALKRANFQHAGFASTPLTPSIGALSNLTTLCLKNNGFVGQLPDSLGNCLALENLDCSNNRFEGRVPPSLGKLTKLWRLDLSNNAFTGPIPPALASCGTLHDQYSKESRLNLANNDLEGDIPQELTSKMGLELKLCENPKLTAASLSIQTAQFPLVLVPRAVALQFKRIPPYEEVASQCDTVALVAKPYKLFCLNDVRNGQQVSRKQLAFISHRWLSPSRNVDDAHPDDESNTKLRHIQKLLTHFPHVSHVWLDFCCIPQKDAQAANRAISSLSYYVHCCEYFFAVAGSMGETEDASDFNTYKKRGWCRTELLAARCPWNDGSDNAPWHNSKPFVSVWSGDGETKHTEDAEQHQLFHLTLGGTLDPREGEFFDPSDKAKVGPLVDVIHAAIAASGLSDEMATETDVDKSPIALSKASFPDEGSRPFSDAYYAALEDAERAVKHAEERAAIATSKVGIDVVNRSLVHARQRLDDGKRGFWAAYLM
jgi:hypothetical protein